MNSILLLLQVLRSIGTNARCSITDERNILWSHISVTISRICILWLLLFINAENECPLFICLIGCSSLKCSRRRKNIKKNVTFTDKADEHFSVSKLCTGYWSVVVCNLFTVQPTIIEFFRRFEFWADNSALFNHNRMEWHLGLSGYLIESMRKMMRWFQ